MRLIAISTLALIVSGCAGMPRMMEQRSSYYRLPDSDIEYSFTRYGNVPPSDDDPEATVESMSLTGSTFVYRKNITRLGEYGWERLETVAYVTPVQSGPPLSNNPAIWSDARTGVKMNIATRWWLNRIEGLLQSQARTHNEFCCDSPEIQGRSFRPSLGQALAKDNFVRLDVAYNSYRKLMRYEQEYHCGRSKKELNVAGREAQKIISLIGLKKMHGDK